MRIADHAVALQSSPALQQPSNAAHQQQVLSPEAARAAAAAKNDQHAHQVSQPENTEGRIIQDHPGGKPQGKRDSKKEKLDPETDSESKDMRPHQPGSGDLIDIVA
jgi:hypothetical protein